MGRNQLKERKTWQDQSGLKAETAENRFYNVFAEYFENTNYQIVSKPRIFKDIYCNIHLCPEIMQSIYCPPKMPKHHGIIPDYAILNKKTEKIIFVEVKRQDGWVEGKKPSAGRGNAHERACKLFTPGLLKILREAGRVSDDILPFWVVFQGDIARDPKRVREIHCWFGDYRSNFFLWSNQSSSKKILLHFEEYIKPHLE